MNLTAKEKEHIFQEFLREICHISDKEYQRRIWIRGEGPECDDFTEIVCRYSSAADWILEEPRDYGILGSQFTVLKKFHNAFEEFWQDNDLPQLFIDTPEWTKITLMAKDVLQAFGYQRNRVQKYSIHYQNLVGTLYTCSDGKKPGIMLLSGSDGGVPGKNAIPESFVEYLVKSGFTVLALAYFGMDRLPNALENIPLEYFISAIEWFKRQAYVDPFRIGVIGQSRGGELALLLASSFPELIQAVVACAPCNMICGGFPHPNRPAWTCHHKPLTPYLSGLSNADDDLAEADDIKMAIESNKIPRHANTAEDPYVIADLFAARKETPRAQEAQIAVEKISCPLLLISGDKDEIWPSYFFCELIMKRLSDCNWKFYKEHIHYKNAGHGVLTNYDGPIYHPMGGFWCRLGGTVDGNKNAHELSWLAITNFLHSQL